MRTILLGAFVTALAGAGCATSSEIQSGAYAHMQKADYYQAQGDYYRAARERDAANKQLAKAQRRAYDEAYYGGYWF